VAVKKATIGFIIWWAIGYGWLCWNHVQRYDLTLATATAFVMVGAAGPLLPVFSFLHDSGFDVVLIKKRGGDK
jgi:hypothetical protein